MSTNPDRRRFLATGGALVVSFSLWPALAAAQEKGDAKKPPLPGSLEQEPMLDAWIRIGADDSITVFTGKAELGQGIKTALIQVAAEELVVEPSRITLVTADTARTPDEQYTAGSQSMQHSGTAIMNAAAQVRQIVVGLAAARWGVAADRLAVENGVVRATDGRSASYGDLVGDRVLHVRADPVSPLRDPKARRVMGHALPRVDIPAKVSGGAAYVHDLRLPGMVHARVVRPPSYAAKLVDVATDRVQKLPGVIKVVRDASYLAVITEHEYQAVVAMRMLTSAARWDEQPMLPEPARMYEHLASLPSKDRLDAGDATAPAPVAGALEATFRRPYQMHASIGPSCAVGLMKDDMLTVWTHSQGVYPLRNAIAELLGMPRERVRCVHLEGSGCYGHNAADDAGADAALCARALPGRPVRVQWMREHEHTWEPYGSAMVTRVQGSLDGNGNVAQWSYEVWSSTHSTRPAPAGNLAPAWALQQPVAQPVPKPIPLPSGGGDRNAVPVYAFPSPRVVYHFIEQMPLRVSALRALGAYANVFSAESFMDELARAAKADPVVFRLRHLADQRARDVVQTAAERFGWAAFERRRGRGRGFAYARYKTLAAYCAMAFEVEVERDTGRVRVVRAVAAIDSGEAVNPDGIRNQTEGGIIQSISWTLFESVAFDRTRVTSRDWAGYPILRFGDLPDLVNVHVINRPGAPFLGTGEAAQGPAAAALANALYDATGVRLREIPFTRERVKAALS
ncbi:MAG TPA: molybdopterin cofactor-binding domain-containing protein [Casimicrobiaceae bacterium]|jgi:CO/xanthine dehydrogenase Mo-binding subunit